MQPFNKYYPKDFDPSKHNSVNQHVGSHPLGNRARKLKTEGILIIRFELPFNIWCLGCNNHIGRGVRFNAEKKKIGNYFSTPIWSFRMKCHLCDHWFEIQTDPKNTQYVVTEGARKKVEEFDPEDIGLIPMKDDKLSEPLDVDPLYQLDKSLLDEKKAKEHHEFFERLMESNDQLWKDPFSKNQHLRKKFRTEKKERMELQKDCQRIASKIGTVIPILPETDQDRQLATEILQTKDPDPTLRHKMELKLERVKNQSIFSSPSTSSLSHRKQRSSNTLPTTTSSSSSSLSSMKSRKPTKLSKRVSSAAKLLALKDPGSSVFDVSFHSTPPC